MGFFSSRVSFRDGLLLEITVLKHGSKCYSFFPVGHSSRRLDSHDTVRFLRVACVRKLPARAVGKKVVPRKSVLLEIQHSSRHEPLGRPCQIILRYTQRT